MPQRQRNPAGYARATADAFVAYYDFGERYLGIRHNGHNDIGDPVPSRRQEPVAEHDGLSHLGRELIARANERGILVDVSHSAMRTVALTGKLTTATPNNCYNGIGRKSPAQEGQQ